MELNFEKVKVLLVDDDVNFAFAMKSLLKSKGLEITSMTNPKEALDYLKNNSVNMILLDYYMPEMTGEQFLTELRKFDKETIVFLQTAFSEEKPEFEMLKSLNIQGYIDKNKDPNDIFLDIVSGVKMANLLTVIKAQEKEILKINYEKAIIGNLIVNLVNEAKDQIMVITAMNESVKMGTDEYSKETECISNALNKTYKLYEALNFESIENCTIGKLAEIVKILVRPTLILNNVKLEIKYEDDSIIIDNVRSNVYFIIRIIEILSKNNITDIIIELKEFNDKNYFEVAYLGEKININIDAIKILDENKLVEYDTENNKINLFI